MRVFVGMSISHQKPDIRIFVSCCNTRRKEAINNYKPYWSFSEIWLLFTNRVSWSMQPLSSLLNWWLIHSFSGCHTTSHSIVSCLVVSKYLDWCLSDPHEAIKGDDSFDRKEADLMATLYDVGGIFGKPYIHVHVHLLSYEWYSHHHGTVI